MDISSDSSSSDEDTATGAYWDSNVWFALHRPCVRRGILTILDLEVLLSIYDTYRVLSIYLGNTACLHVKHTYFSASL